jgi:hypothetical protein
MLEKSHCDGCGKEVDFKKHASGYCNSHKKDYCWGCINADILPCSIEGHCKRLLLSNPAWFVKLKVYDE